MTRDQFAHAIRAAGGVLGTNELLIIGSQALHGSVIEDLPAEAMRSLEVDVAALDDRDERLADLIDGSIGEGSMFHDTFGYYAQGVVETTAVLPPGWRDRLVRFETPATNGIIALCLEVHDLWLSKAVAGREKDIEFCRVLLDRAIVKRELLRARLSTMSAIDDSVRESIMARIGR